jgi:hypothetical protein
MPERAIRSATIIVALMATTAAAFAHPRRRHISNGSHMDSVRPVREGAGRNSSRSTRAGGCAEHGARAAASDRGAEHLGRLGGRADRDGRSPRHSDKLHVVERFVLDQKTMKLTRSYVAEDSVYLKGQATRLFGAVPSGSGQEARDVPRCLDEKSCHC